MPGVAYAVALAMAIAVGGLIIRLSQSEEKRSLLECAKANSNGSRNSLLIRRPGNYARYSG